MAHHGHSRTHGSPPPSSLRIRHRLIILTLCALVFFNLHPVLASTNSNTSKYRSRPSLTSANSSSTSANRSFQPLSKQPSPLSNVSPSRTSAARNAVPVAASVISADRQPVVLPSISTRQANSTQPTNLSSSSLQNNILSSTASRAPSRLFEHFDLDNDGLLNEKEVAALLRLLKKKKDEPSAQRSDRPVGTHDITIDGETISVGQSDFDLLFKQVSNLKHTKDPSKDPRMTLQEDIIFVKDLVIVFLAATIGGVIATNFRQPPLIGFLLGGMTVGPGGFGIVTELVEVETLASLGISFLLFSLGIEFSISELHGVRRVVFVGGLSSTCGVVILTAALSLFLSLVSSIPEAVALGLAVSLSSTAVVLQCLPSPHANSYSSSSHSSHTPSSPAVPSGAVQKSNSENNEQTQVDTNEMQPFENPGLNHVEKGTSRSSGKTSGTSFDSPRSRKVMLGLLVFQDVMIGLILALLPTLRGSLAQFVEELMSAMLRLGCFVMLSLILAEFVLPSLSERLDASKSQEVFTIGCVVFCLAMSYLSEEMGLAIELGAFAAGIMLSESRHKTRVEDSISSIRSIFSAVFFVSVGMMIHWRYFYQNFARMAILLVVILGAKTLVMGLVIYMLGSLPIRTAMACGSAIAQAGEFTFVVASKGQALQLFSASEARMINGATALSMLITPYIIRHARKFTTGKGMQNSARETSTV